MTKPAKPPGLISRVTSSLSTNAIFAAAGAGVGIIAGRYLLQLKGDARDKVLREVTGAYQRWMHSMTDLGRRRKLDCADCQGHGYGFMLKDDLWEAILDARPANGERIQILCLPCCEKRLLRPILADDLNEQLPINAPLLYAWGRPQPRYEPPT